MSYKTVEVELENGCVRPSGGEALPARAHALLTLLDANRTSAAANCKELAERWVAIERLPLEEANSLADDMDQSRASLPSLKSAWD